MSETTTTETTETTEVTDNTQTTDVQTTTSETQTPATETKTDDPLAWVGTDLDEDTRNYVLNKSWKTPADMLKSYKNLESLKGVDPERFVEVPSPDAEPEKFDQIFQKLGKPESLEGYEFPETIPAEEGKWFAEAAHGAHLTGEQFKQVLGAYENQVKAEQEKAQADFTQKKAAEEADLKKEWGASYDQKVREATIAAEKLGFTKGQIEALSWESGYKSAMKTLDNLAKKFSEGGFVGEGGKDTSNQALGPDAAKAELTKLNNDPSFQKLLSGESVANADYLNKRFLDLSRWASGVN